MQFLKNLAHKLIADEIAAIRTAADAIGKVAGKKEGYDEGYKTGKQAGIRLTRDTLAENLDHVLIALTPNMAVADGLVREARAIRETTKNVIKQRAHIRNLAKESGVAADRLDLVVELVRTQA